MNKIIGPLILYGDSAAWIASGFLINYLALRLTTLIFGDAEAVLNIFGIWIHELQKEWRKCMRLDKETFSNINLFIFIRIQMIYSES